jgi:geranylgeranyl diphosphate synthase, type I
MNSQENSLLHGVLIALEAALRRQCALPDGECRPFYGMMQYHLGWVDSEMHPVATPAGKRVRPLLLLLSSLAAGGDLASAMPAAVGIELLHNFSLIHDDIEDDSAIRRHRPALWKVFGLAQGCNAGDGMFGLARLAFHGLAAAGHPPARTLNAMAIFDRTCLELTEGQYLDISFEDRLDVSVAEYVRMIQGKTGALLASAPELGALLGGADAEIVKAFREFGLFLGRAFQLFDDVLGIWGREEETGKSASSDILSKKKSMPVLYALSQPGSGARLRDLYAGPAFGTEELAEVLQLLESAKARDFTIGEAARAQRSAEQELDRLAAVMPGQSPSQHEALSTLRSLVTALAARRA